MSPEQHPSPDDALELDLEYVHRILADHEFRLQQRAGPQTNAAALLAQARRTLRRVPPVLHSTPPEQLPGQEPLPF